jgi:hypothetical protein
MPECRHTEVLGVQYLWPFKFLAGIFEETDKKNWRDAGYWLAYTLIGGLTPIWCGYIFLRLFSHQPSLDQFTEHGEFALYAAAIIAPVFHTISRDLNIPGLKGRQFFQLASFCCMFIGVAIYVAVSSAYASTPSQVKIDQDFLRTLTLLLFALATVVAFFITVLDYSRLSTDLREVVAGQQKNLRDEFQQLQD